MSQETRVFMKELQKLDDDLEKMNKADEDAETIIPLEGFLDNELDFFSKMGALRRSLILVAEAATRPLFGLPQSPYPSVNVDEEGKPVEPTEEGPASSQKMFTIEKALVLVVGIVAMAILAEKELLPAMSVVLIIIGSLALAFYPQLRSLIASLLAKEEEKEPRAIGLEDWIKESFSLMFDKYSGARTALKFQPQEKGSLPDFMTMGVDPSLYDRKKWFQENLPPEFLSRIGDIILYCNRCAWERRKILIQAIEMSKQAEMGMGMKA